MNLTDVKTIANNANSSGSNGFDGDNEENEDTNGDYVNGGKFLLWSPKDFKKDFKRIVTIRQEVINIWILAWAGLARGRV